MVGDFVIRRLIPHPLWLNDSRGAFLNRCFRPRGNLLGGKVITFNVATGGHVPVADPRTDRVWREDERRSTTAASDVR